jgi:hypothetical protein
MPGDSLSHRCQRVVILRAVSFLAS